MMDAVPPTRRTLIGLMGAVPVAAAVQLSDFLDAGSKAAAARGEVIDCTDAFNRALASGPRVAVPPGHYGLTGLRLPTGGGIIGGGGVVLHQFRPDRPALECVSDAVSGQLADLLVEGVEFRGHRAAITPVVRLAAGGSYAIWRSRFAFFAKNSLRALDVGDGEASNIFECAFEIVSEGVRDVAVRVMGGVYNRYHLFLTQTPVQALDDRSSASEIRVVAENSVIFRGQTNQITARVEGIAARRAAFPAAIVDQGFGNTFLDAEVNMPMGDLGKLDFAFSAFQGSVFVSPQVIGPGAPPHPFAPTAGHPFTVIGGRSRTRHKIETIFDGSGPDRDPRSITFIGDVGDFTTRPTRAGAVAVQRVSPINGETVRIAPATQLLIIDAHAAVVALSLIPAEVTSALNGWCLSISTVTVIARLHWPAGNRYSHLPTTLAAGERLDLVYLGDADMWLPR